MPVTDEILLEELVINPEFESVIPPLTHLEFDQLQKNILEDKEVFHPIIVWNKTIIDGHNRYKILKDNPGLQFRIRKIEFSDKHQAVAWICKNQIGRRNLSEAQINILMGRQFEEEKNSVGGDYKSEESKSNRQNVGKVSGRSATAQKIADEHGVSYRTVERAGEYVRALDIAKVYDPNIERDILAGEINPSKKDVIHIGKAPKEKVSGLVKQLREQKQTTKKTHAGNSIGSISARMAEDKPPATESDMLVSLQGAVKMLIRTFETTFKHYPDLLKKAEHRTIITEILNELKKYLNRIEEGAST